MQEKKLKMDWKGYENYQSKIEKLELELAEVRKYKGEVAIFQGDTWHDNPDLDYTEAKEKRLMFRIAKMKNNLNNIEIIEKSSNSSVVSIGDTLRIMIDDGILIEELIIELVSDISDISDDVNLVSVNSILGQAILNLEIGETTEYTALNSIIRVKKKEKIK